MLLRTRSLTFKNMPRAAIPISLVPLSWYLPKSVAKTFKISKYSVPRASWSIIIAQLHNLYIVQINTPIGRFLQIKIYFT